MKRKEKERKKKNKEKSWGCPISIRRCIGRKKTEIRTFEWENSDALDLCDWSYLDDIWYSLFQRDYYACYAKLSSAYLWFTSNVNIMSACSNTCFDNRFTIETKLEKRKKQTEQNKYTQAYRIQTHTQIHTYIYTQTDMHTNQQKHTNKARQMWIVWSA